jgi:hypothetical protein
MTVPEGGVGCPLGVSEQLAGCMSGLRPKTETVLRASTSLDAGHRHHFGTAPRGLTSLSMLECPSPAVVKDSLVFTEWCFEIELVCF